ncbi:MAG: serine/threonine-protein kinase [Cyanobacteria bacterium P01_G01_bin.67]
MKSKILGSRYQVLEYIAKGGFGKTYLAEDTQLPGKDLCVVKELSPTVEESKFLQVARRLFKAEASALHNLGHHEQIPELLAYFEEAEKFYLVQQYIKGQTLERELNPEFAWSESKVIELLADTLQILDFIHSKGVIHRDLKPANLIRRQCDQKIVLVDFGTVKNMLQGHTNLGQLTIPVGTKGYMPTEQARGKPRATSDLYALGMIGIQALTRVAPLELEEDDNGELLWSHLAQVSPQLAQILTRMTRYHFNDRYQSAAETLQALNALADAGVTKPQLDKAINPSWSDDLLQNRTPTVSVSEVPRNNLAIPLISGGEVNLSSPDRDLTLVDSPPAAIEVDLPPSKFLSQESKKSQLGSIVGLAIALGGVIFGSTYWLMQQTISEPQLDKLESPQNPDSVTPRMDQGEGFRENL